MNLKPTEERDRLETELAGIPESQADERTRLRIRKLRAEIGLLGLQIDQEQGAVLPRETLRAGCRSIALTGRQALSTWARTVWCASGKPEVKAYLESELFYAMAFSRLFEDRA